MDFSEIPRNAHFWPILDWSPKIKNEERVSPDLSLNGFKGTCVFKFSKKHSFK